MAERNGVNQEEKTLIERGRRRQNRVIVLSIVVLLLMLMLIAQGGFNLSPIFSPETAGETLLLYALSTLNFLTFVTLLFVLLRNVLKLVRERRAGRLGTKFKARLVGYAIGLSLLPVLLLFFFAYGLLNRSIDRWFGEPARQIVEDAKGMKESFYKKEEDELKNIAHVIAGSMRPLIDSKADAAAIEQILNDQLVRYDLAFAQMIMAGKTVTAPKKQRGITDRLPDVLAQVPPILEVPRKDQKYIYFFTSVQLSEGTDDGRTLVVARAFPRDLILRAANIDEQYENFRNLRDKIRRIKATYILLLAAVALLLIFAAVWLALYVARGITVPIQALAEATDRVAHGNFARPVDTVAEDELAGLVNSFNQMSAQLAENRERLELAAEDLRRTNLALDNRRRYIEAVLESLSTGVISTDEGAKIATINRAAAFMLGLEDRPAIGTAIRDLMGGEQGKELETLCRRARRIETAQAEIEFKRPDGSLLHTTTTAIALKSPEGQMEGWVIVIEDLNDLIQAERAAAWGEVARRMAHEIKNPLTPIQLSAERIMRNYERKSGPQADARLGEIVSEGTATIVREVSALQRMVEEFSRFARLPEARLVESSLNDVVREAVGLYTGRLEGIRIEIALASDLPVLHLDPAQMKQILVNLIDNAIESLESTDAETNGRNGANGKPPAEVEKLIQIKSYWMKQSEVVLLEVADTGHGIRPADRHKLFLPKFSTRNRGTGLGLAIVSHIIADHKGRIWVRDHYPQGARFVIELPANRGE